MQLVKIDGTVFLGELDEGQVLSAMQVDNRFMTEDLGKAQIATFIEREHLGKLNTIGFGTTSAVQSRELNDDEEQQFSVANFSMEVAISQAVRQLEVAYFQKSFAGK